MLSRRTSLVQIAFGVLLMGSIAACSGPQRPDGGDTGDNDAVGDTPVADADPDAALDGSTDAPPGDAPVVDVPTTPMCGNRRIEMGEQCDDGNRMNNDGCDMNCQFERSMSCGDRVVDYARGEECDDGNMMNGDGCDMNCRRERPATCGNGMLEIAAGEQCDDGNTLPGDGCSPTCQFEPVGRFCGDMMRDPGEVCDDGNTMNGDSCNPTCNFGNRTTLFAGTPGMAGTTDGMGMAARFGGSLALTADTQYIYAADNANRRIRRIDVMTAAVTTIAGNGGMAVVDNANGRMASFMGMEAAATDGRTLWVADSGRIRAISLTPPHAVTTVAGGAPCMSAMCFRDGVGPMATFSDLRGLTFYNGFVWSVDANAAVVRRFDPRTNMVTTVAGTAFMTGGTDGVGAAARFVSPRYIASDNSGMLYIADTNGATIRAFNTVTNAVTTFAGTGTAGYRDAVGTMAQIHRPRGMTSDGTSVYWNEFNQHTIRQGVLATRTVSTMIGMPGVMGNTEGVGSMARIASPWGIVYHFPSRSLFFSDGGNFTLRRIQ